MFCHEATFYLLSDDQLIPKSMAATTQKGKGSLHPIYTNLAVHKGGAMPPALRIEYPDPITTCCIENFANHNSNPNQK
jgi:hypothetical protein